MNMLVNNEIMDNLDRVLQDLFNDDTNSKQQIIISIRNNSAIQKTQTDTFYMNLILQNSIFIDYLSNVISQSFNIFLNASDYPRELEAFKKQFVSTSVIPMKKLCLGKLKLDVLKSSLVSNVIKDHIRHVLNHTGYVHGEKDNMENTLTLMYDRIHQQLLENTCEDYKSVIHTVLQKYIDSEVIETKSDTEKSDLLGLRKFRNIFIAKNKREPNLFEETKYSSFVTNYDKLLDIYMNDLETDFCIQFDTIIAEFKRVFKREITVHEYQRYYKRCNYVEPCQVFAEYETLYNMKFTICENIYKQYTLDALTFQIFTNTFLKYIDLDEGSFIEATIDIIINDTIYETKMKSLIEKQYHKLFSTEIESYNLTHYYKVILAKKYHLQDDSIVKLISKLDDETKSHVQTISGIFERILLRASDEYENEKFLSYFRNSKLVTPTQDIENELFSSLEYQDVLKDWIRDSLKIKNRSIIFKILDYIQHFVDKNETRHLNDGKLLNQLKKKFNEYF
jgi:hypothetical protein